MSFDCIREAQGASTVVPVAAVLRALGAVAAPAKLLTTVARRGGGDDLRGTRGVDMQRALEVLKAEEHPSQLQRSLAYTVVRHLPAYDLVRWREVTQAAMRDLSAADHPDHTVHALHTLACLPGECLLDLAVDGATDARFLAVLEHISPAIRSAAVTCIAGAWTRVWKLLMGGGLRGRVLRSDETGIVLKEGDVRQRACDRVVVVWKKILERCTKDEDDNVVATAFGAMRDLFASCWVMDGIPRSFEAFDADKRKISLVMRSLLLRVFKSIGVRVYSLVARLRSLTPSGSALARALPGMAAFFRYAMASGQTVRLEGTSSDFSSVGLAREFVDTILLPLLSSASSRETLMSAAFAVLELCDATHAAHAIQAADRQRWCDALARAMLAQVGGANGGGCGGGFDGESVLLDGAGDSVALLLYRCLEFLPQAGMRVECAVAIVRAVSSMGVPEGSGLSQGQGASREPGTFRLDTSLGSNGKAGDRLRRHLVRGVARKVLRTCVSANVKQGTFLAERFFRAGEWMRSLWDGRIWLPAFREELAAIFLEEAKALAPECLQELDEQNTADSQRGSHGSVNPASAETIGESLSARGSSSNVILDLSLGDMLEMDDVARRRYAAELPRACLPWLAVVHTLLHICAPTLNWPGILPACPTCAASAYIDLCTMLCNRIGAHRDARLQQMLDDLFEWHLPSIASPFVRLHVIRMLCAFWACDAHDLGDAETLVAYMRDLLFGHALCLAVQGSEEFLPYPLPTKHDILGEGSVGVSGRRAASGYGHGPVLTGEGSASAQSGGEATRIGSTGHAAAYSVVEFANVLLPSAALFASHNPVARDCVQDLLDRCCETNLGPRERSLQNISSFRNPILISLACRMKKWLAMERGDMRAKRTMLGFSHLVGEHAPLKKRVDEACRYRQMMSAPASFRVLNGAMDPVACQVRHLIVEDCCRVDVRIVNLTRSNITNLVFELGLGGPVAPMDGAPAQRRLVEGELLPGEVVEWSTTLSIIGFGDIFFHPRLTVPQDSDANRGALCSTEKDWEMPGIDAHDHGDGADDSNVGKALQRQRGPEPEPEPEPRSQPALCVHCSPYVLGITSVMCPTQIDAITFANYWGASKFAYAVQGVWESIDDKTKGIDSTMDADAGIFKDPFRLEFAPISLSRSAAAGGILSAAFFSTTVTREIVCLNITAFEISGAPPGCAHWSAKFEFRSDKRYVVDTLQRVSGRSRWFRQLRQQNDTEEAAVPVLLPQVFAPKERVKSALMRWRQIRPRR